MATNRVTFGDTKSNTSLTLWAGGPLFQDSTWWGPREHNLSVPEHEMTHAEFVALAQNEQDNIVIKFLEDDQLYHQIRNMLSGTVETIIPRFEDVNHPIMFRSQVKNVYLVS